jgi:hypothetical protein
MVDPGNGARRFEVHCSGAMAETVRTLHRLAARQGRGKAVTNAFQMILHRLERNPYDVGEPVYRLPILRMQVRLVTLGPLSVEFAVCDDRPLIFIKGVRLFSA